MGGRGDVGRFARSDLVRVRIRASVRVRARAIGTARVRVRVGVRVRVRVKVRGACACGQALRFLQRRLPVDVRWGQVRGSSLTC